MTIKLNDGENSFIFAFNTPNLSGNLKMNVSSRFSNTSIFDVAVTILETNDRYTSVSVPIDVLLPLQHLNSLGKYEIYNADTLQPVDSGVFKLITGSGGTNGTQSYISDNEDREAIVVYRPEY